MKISKVVNTKGETTGYMFYCPGCRMVHAFDNRWTFDGNMQSPTFSPSLLVGPWWRMPHDWDWEKAPKDANGEYVLDDTGHLLGAFEARCHSFMRNGKIEFLSDCTHELAGQTIEIPELPDWAI